MNGYKIKIALKARPRMSLLVVAAAAIALSGALFSAQAQEPIKIGFGVSLTGGLASSGKAHLMSKQTRSGENFPGMAVKMGYSRLALPTVTAGKRQGSH